MPDYPSLLSRPIDLIAVVQLQFPDDSPTWVLPNKHRMAILQLVPGYYCISTCNSNEGFIFVFLSSNNELEVHNTDLETQSLGLCVIPLGTK